MLALHWLLPVAQVVAWPYRLAGAAPVALGLGLNLWADRLFKRAGTTVKPFETSRRLVTGGPYRFSRHPMYVGMTAVLAGVAVGLGSVSPAVVAVAFAVVVDRAFITAEERAMVEAFGNEYEAYRRRVRRWL
jgi:protein-S-isoprenylcysteine O-methyltransferase Ste14